MVPACTTRLYLRAACTIFTPSSTVTADGLLDVHVLAGFAGLDRHVSVPVIGRGDAHDVDGLVGQDLPEIAHTLGLPLGHLDRQVQVAIEEIADGRDLNILLFHGDAEVRTTHLSHADECGGDAIVGAADVAGEDLRGERGGGGGFEKLAAVGGHSEFYCRTVRLLIGQIEEIVEQQPQVGAACISFLRLQLLE